jgi:DNA-binding NarL/FixJ family response regulator
MFAAARTDAGARAVDDLTERTHESPDAMSARSSTGPQTAGDSRGPVRIFLLDDHEVVRAGVAAVLDSEIDLEVVGQADSAAGALAVVDECSPDVAVLDVRLGDGSGIAVCAEIRERHPEVACLILTSFDNDQAIVDAWMAGAAGFVVKQIKGNALVDSIRRVARGEMLLDDATARLAMKRIDDSGLGDLARLTPQERRIFDLIGEGCTNRHIADELFLAEKTVKNYVSNMLAKLGMSRRTEAAALAARIDERRKSEG